MRWQRVPQVCSNTKRLKGLNKVQTLEIIKGHQQWWEFTWIKSLRDNKRLWTSAELRQWQWQNSL